MYVMFYDTPTFVGEYLLVRVDFISGRCTVIMATRSLGRQFRVAGELHVIFYDTPTFVGEYLLVKSRYFGLRHVTRFFDERTCTYLVDFLDQVSSVQFHGEQYCIITSMFHSQPLLSVGHHCIHSCVL